jgi:hypothetical protein
MATKLSPSRQELHRCARALVDAARAMSEAVVAYRKALAEEVAAAGPHVGKSGNHPIFDPEIGEMVGALMVFLCAGVGVTESYAMAVTAAGLLRPDLVPRLADALRAGSEMAGAENLPTNLRDLLNDRLRAATEAAARGGP